MIDILKNIFGCVMDTKIIRPVIEPHRITSPYGMRILDGTQAMHDGIDYVGAGDYGGPADRTVFAIADGVVISDFDGYNPAKRWNPSAPDSAGNMVIIEHNLHGTKYFVRYVHLAKNTVSNGERVKCGQVIGEYGDVGYSFGPHLHLDMWTASWQRIDPTPVLLRGLRASGIIA